MLSQQKNNANIVSSLFVKGDSDFAPFLEVWGKIGNFDWGNFTDLKVIS